MVLYKLAPSINLEAPTTTLAPKGETTHYDLCVALLLQIMFAVHAKAAVKLKPLKNLRPIGPSTLKPAGLVHRAPATKGGKRRNGT